MLGKLFDVVEEVVGTTAQVTGVVVDTAATIAVNTLLEPFHTLEDTLDFLDGLSAGDIRADAAARFASRYVEAMAIEQVMRLYTDGFD